MMLNKSGLACVRPTAARRSCIVRVVDQDAAPPTSTPASSSAKPEASPVPVSLKSAPPQPQQSSIPAPSNTATAPVFLNAYQEAINSRAAMLGFVAAVIAEAVTHQGVISQLFGKWENQVLVEKAVGGADLGFGFVVTIVSLATVLPKLIENIDVNSTSYGPFTPALESTVGRVAQMGFAGLLITELVKGSAVF